MKIENGYIMIPIEAIDTVRLNENDSILIRNEQQFSLVVPDTVSQTAKAEIFMKVHREAVRIGHIFNKGLSARVRG